MERKEEALVAIEALNGTMFKGRQLAVELSKAQPLINQIASAGNLGKCHCEVKITVSLEMTVNVYLIDDIYFVLQGGERAYFLDHLHHLSIIRVKRLCWQQLLQLPLGCPYK